MVTSFPLLLLQASQRINRSKTSRWRAVSPVLSQQKSTPSKFKLSSLPTPPPAVLSSSLKFSSRLLPYDGIPLYVGASPLLKKAGLTIEEVQRDAATWAALGSELAHQLGFSADKLSESQLKRVFQYYLPVFSWAWKQIQEHRQAGQPGPLVVSSTELKGYTSCLRKMWLERLDVYLYMSFSVVQIGISAPQGCGKTTVVESLQHLCDMCNM